MKFLRQYLSRDFGLAWCHSSAALTIHTTLFSQLLQRKLFSVLPNVQRPNCPAKFFVLWLYPFDWQNSVANQSNCLTLARSCMLLNTLPSYLLFARGLRGSFHGSMWHCCWDLTFTAVGLWIHHLRTAIKYFSCSFPPFVSPPLPS